VELLLIFRNAIKAVDGSGSLIDADLLDTISSGSFLRSDVSGNYTSGILTFNSGNRIRHGLWFNFRC